MGAGASTEAKEKLVAASPEDVQKMVAELPEDTKMMLLAALEGGKKPAGKLAWYENFIIGGHYHCKDIPAMTAGTLKDAAIQVKEEPKAPRFDVMGVPANEDAPEDAKDNIFWLAEFENMQAWDGPDHKGRETNKEFIKIYQASGAHADEGMGGMVKDMAGSYTGAAWHLEKGMPSGEHTVWQILLKFKAKDEESADKLVEVLKDEWLVAIENEEGALATTICRMKNMFGPIPKDDLEVCVWETFKTADDFDKHKKTKHVEELMPKMMECIAGPPGVYIFPETKRFEK
eukprot:TRINITY_DN6317_c0_g1_i4.p1 TRINITY_DN6317_c0_g1~~TRINITY_DN6317_c0_g1_i4.p1  ORF type:complete len:288 (-),score=83.57 TRINITY_DN6317_c0_g1_i4:118-981(-)